jgi:hypothetical protein
MGRHGLQKGWDALNASLSSQGREDSHDIIVPSPVWLEKD